MMNPRDARQRIVELLTDLEITHEIERIIRDAVLAEREACAQVAESFIPSGFTGKGKAGNSYAVARDDRAHTIAVSIRARNTDIADTPPSVFIGSIGV